MYVVSFRVNFPHSACFLPMPFALNNMMANGFPSTACVGIDVGNGCGVAGGCIELQELQAQSLIRRYLGAI